MIKQIDYKNIVSKYTLMQGGCHRIEPDQEMLQYTEYINVHFNLFCDCRRFY